MKRFVGFVRGTRRFRYTLTVLLAFGAVFAVGRTRSEEGKSAAGQEKVEAVEKVASDAGEKSGEVVSVDRAELEEVALKFLTGLSDGVSEDASAKPVELPEDVVGLACREEKKDGEVSLYAELRDEKKAGDYIHELRLRGFVPVKSVRWINPVADELPGPDAGKKESGEEVAPMAVLTGIVTVDDKPNPAVENWEPRHRAVSIFFRKSGGKLLVSGVERPTVRELGGVRYVEGMLRQLREGQVDEAWAAGSKLMRSKRDAREFYDDVKAAGFLDATGIKWGKATAIEGGFKLHGTLELDGEKGLPFYVALLETADGLRVLDFQMTDSFLGRVLSGRADTLDMVVAIVALALVLGFVYIIVSYVKGLWGSPRELYILFFTKLTEYSAYGAAQLTFMFYLRDDVGMSDLEAGTYYSFWSTTVTAVTMVVGAVCDAIGIKKTLLIGSVFLLLSRAVMPYAENFWVVTLLGFIPLGIGVAITGPVLSVGIKRYTTIEGAALGFGLFYTLMNVGWAIGAKIFDVVRVSMGERGSLEFMGDSLSTWQVLFGIGFFINVPDLLAIMWMREGAEMTEDGVRISGKTGGEAPAVPGRSMLERGMDSLKAGVVGSAKVFGDNFVHRAFWVFILLIGITVFARLTFFHFHITWPSYGIRYFGEGSLVGNVFGVLNPVLIVFLVPVVAYFTRKVRSYWLLLVGTIISVASVVLVVVPPETFAWMEDTWFGVMVYDRWLEVPVGNRDPFYLSMVLFVTAFTVGEAIWSPRLMQFTAEIAPPGREGSYISLSFLPYFGAKFLVGPMAGMLLTEYAPEFGVGGIYGYYPDHQLIWWWIGGMAALTPIGMVAFRKLYHRAEARAEEEAAQAERGDGV